MDHTERMFLAMVLKKGVKEYLPKRETKKNHLGRVLAEAWIFSESRESRESAFGFEFICLYLGIDPPRARERILKLKEGGNRGALYYSTARIEAAQAALKKSK